MKITREVTKHDPTGRHLPGNLCSCGAAWYYIYADGKLAAIECGSGHKPIEFLTKAQMRFR